MRKITTKLIILIMLCASISQAAPLWNILSVNTNTHSINLTNQIIDMSRVTSLKIPYNTASNDAARVDYVNIAIANITPASIGAVSNTALGIANAGGLTNAWQNPTSATNWTWTSDGTNITLTGYTGPNAVVIPNVLDGKPVAGFGTIFQARPITSISGGANITAISVNAFNSCAALTSISLPNVTTVGQSSFAFCITLTSISLPNVTTIGQTAFDWCTALTSVSLPNVTTVGNGAFERTALTSVSLPNVTTIGDGAFFSCPALRSVYIGGQNAPAEGTAVYLDAPNATNYITSSTAIGWTTTWNGRPVVRLPVYANTFYGSGASLTGITPASIGAVSNTAIGISNAGGMTNGQVLSYSQYPLALTNAAAFDAAGTAAGLVAAYSNTMTTTVNKAATAWQNPASATNWTWTSDGKEITLTSYNFSSLDVVIPDMLDGLPVTGFGTIFSPGGDGSAITSVSGGANVAGLVRYAFENCDALSNVILRSVTSVAGEVTSYCTALTSVTLPAATNIDTYAFYFCTALTSVSFGQNAPADLTNVYYFTPNVTNYVTNPQATGWGATWNARPVVRLPVYADEYWRLGTNLTTLLAGKVGTNGNGSALTGITAAQVGAVSNTPLGIANAGGVTNGGIVYNGTPLNNGSLLNIVTNQFALSHRTGLVETVVGDTTYVDVTDTLQSVVTRGSTATSATITTNITSIIRPAIDSTNAIRITNSDCSTNIITIDTLSGKVRIGDADTNYNFSVLGDFYMRGSPAPLGAAAVSSRFFGGLGGSSISNTSTKAGTGGNILIRGGDAGYTVKTWTGSGGTMSAGGYIFLSGGIGGDLCKSNTGNGTGGSGGDLYNYGGTGGRMIPGTATIGGVAGSGGGTQLTGGTGGLAGDAAQITSATLTGGAGGGFVGYGGGGGYVQYGTGTLTGGNGGYAIFGAGGGGQAYGLGIGTTTVATAGNGGNIRFTGGAGGNAYLATSSVGGNGGDISFNPGQPGYSDQTGYNLNYGNIYFGRFNGEAPPNIIYMAMNGYTGNIGIGTNATTEKLYVLGTATISSNLTVGGNASGLPAISSSHFVTKAQLDAITNEVATTNFVLNQNYVTKAVTNGLVALDYLVAQGYLTASATQGLVTASITNEVATTNFVNSSVTSAANAGTNYVNSLMASTYYVTNTLVISNSLDFAITGLAANNIRVRYLNMFLSATNEAATSKRATFKIYNSSARLDDSLVYFDTNQLYWSSLNTTTVGAGSTTCTVSDASGVIIPDRYAVGNGTTFDFLCATQTTATVITWASTNKYAITPNTKVSHANYLTPIFYDDDSQQNSMWCRFAWVTPNTGTVQIIMRYGK